MPSPTSTTTEAPPPGQTNLSTLLKTMKPTLHETTEPYVFATLPNNTTTSTQTTLTTLLPHAKMLFLEPADQAWTLILPRSLARAHDLPFAYPCRQITLAVHSSLEAVGFLAAVTTRLAERVRIGVNPVSGYYHDHLFVADGMENEVLAELNAMAAEQP